MCSMMSAGPKVTLSALAFNFGLFSTVMALVDLTLCSVCLLKNGNPEQIYLAEMSVCFPTLNEAIHLLYSFQGLVTCIQYAVCTVLLYKSTSEHLHWFVWCMICFTGVFILYLRVMFGASPSHESVPIVPILAKGILSSALNVYFMLISLCTYRYQRKQPTELVIV